jgi:hypothetical protein
LTPLVTPIDSLTPKLTPSGLLCDADMVIDAWDGTWVVWVILGVISTAHIAVSPVKGAKGTRVNRCKYKIYEGSVKRNKHREN